MKKIPRSGKSVGRRRRGSTESGRLNPALSVISRELLTFMSEISGLPRTAPQYYSSSAAVLLEGGTSAAHGSEGWTEDMGMEGDGGGVSEGETAQDPIDFQVTNLVTGAITTGTLFSVSSDLQRGSWSWSNNTFVLNASDFDFSIRIDSPFTVQQGTADLQVRNGVITTSDGTGMFAGIFPGVGSPGNFSVC